MEHNFQVQQNGMIIDVTVINPFYNGEFIDWQSALVIIDDENGETMFDGSSDDAWYQFGIDIAPLVENDSGIWELV